jgi:hypothetical protein
VTQRCFHLGLFSCDISTIHLPSVYRWRVPGLPYHVHLRAIMTRRRGGRHTCKTCEGGTCGLLQVPPSKRPRLFSNSISCRIFALSWLWASLGWMLTRNAAYCSQGDKANHNVSPWAAQYTRGQMSHLGQPSTQEDKSQGDKSQARGE